MQRCHAVGPALAPVACCSTSASRGNRFSWRVLFFLALPQFRLLVAGEDVNTECGFAYDADMARHRPNEWPLGQEQLLRSLGETLQSTMLHCNKEINGTCVINDTVSSAGSIRGNFSGDVNITSNAKVTGADVEVYTNGTLRVDGNAIIKAGRVIKLMARRKVLLTSAATVEAAVVILGRSAPTDHEEAASQLEGTQLGPPGPLGPLGPVNLDGNVTVKGHQCVSVFGGGVSIAGSASVTATRVQVGAQENCTLQIVISGAASVEGEVVAIRCSGSAVTLSDRSRVSAMPKKGELSIAGQSVAMPKQGELSIVGQSVLLKSSMPLRANTTHIHATVDVVFSSILNGVNDDDDPTLHIFAGGTLSMNLASGQGIGALSIRHFAALAGIIDVQNTTIRSTGSSCVNQNSTREDICARLLQQQGVPPFDMNDTQVSFELMLVARTALQLQSTTHILVSSVMLCSGQDLDFLGQVIVDTSGHGCPPGTGTGHGEDNCTHTDKSCYSGGGSLVGRGGSGASGASKKVIPVPGASAGDLQNVSSALLPTEGSPGGGCGTQPPCYPPTSWEGVNGAGGGLIWLSGQNVSAASDTEIIADGKEGTTVAHDNKTQTESISGGGAGGQIIFWINNSLKIDGQGQLVLSVQGAPISCGESRISGAGGGGFIGIHSKGNLEPESIRFRLDGGQIRDGECKGWSGLQGLEDTFGNIGMASPLVPCPAGRFGAFCQECERGKWSAAGSLTCQDCTNKPPKYANYTSKGVNNSNCPYKCTRQVPNYRTNSKCLDAPSFVFHFFGGVGGVTAIISCLVVLAGFLLWRRTGKGKRISSRGNHVGSRQGSGSLHRRGDWDQHEESHRSDDLLFTRDKLPYHVCRVYLDGKNRGFLPWHLSAQLPEVVETLVVPETWKSFAQTVNNAAKVHRRGIAVEATLSFLYPPLASIFSRWHAWQRARRVRRYVQGFADGNGEHTLPFWRLSARAPAGELTVLFGCDASATLGHLDFLDNSRSRLDWAPGDLRQECRLLVAHGNGSYMDPFMLDMGDPLVTHLSQSDFGSVAVCSVISTFNRVARTMKFEELTVPGPHPSVARLRQKVEQCATQCGLAGFVQALVIHEHAPSQSESSARRSLGRSMNDLSTTFSDLVPRRNVATQGRRREATVALAAASNPSSATSMLSAGHLSQRHSQMDVPSEPPDQNSLTTPSAVPPSAQLTDVKLCLAFVDFSMLTDLWPPSLKTSSSDSPSSSGSTNPVPQHTAFTSPMSRRGLLQFMELNAPPRLEAVGEAELPHPARHRSRQLTRLFARESDGNTTPTTVLLVTVVLFALDFLSFIITGFMFFTLSVSVSLLWMSVPPLAQLVSIVIGPVFMISELPHLGRLFASFNACGIVSISIAMCTLMAQQQEDSVVFNLFGLLVVCGIKAALFVSANMHVGNLEASLDLSFIDAPQSNFIDNVLAHTPHESWDNGGLGECLNEGRPRANYDISNRWHQTSDNFRQPEDALGNRVRTLSRASSEDDSFQRATSFASPSRPVGRLDVDASPF